MDDSMVEGMVKALVVVGALAVFILGVLSIGAMEIRQLFGVCGIAIAAGTSVWVRDVIRKFTRKKGEK